MAESAYDCIAVGSGPGGYVAAIRAAQLGMKTAVVEKDRVGGRCLNHACMPAKAVLRTADVVTEVREAAVFGIKVAEPLADFPAVVKRRQKVVSTLTGGVSALFNKNGIELLQGSAKLAGQGKVTVESNEIAANTIVLATGSVKRPIPGAEFGGRVIGTEEAWGLTELPKTIAVVGAGASGAEIASAYARLSTDVLLFEALAQVLPTEDADISRVVERGPKRLDRRAHQRAGDRRRERPGGGEPQARRGDGADRVVGHRHRAGPDIEGLGLEEAGVKLGVGDLVEVDGAMRTSAEGVYAIGDLARGAALARFAGWSANPLCEP